MISVDRPVNFNFSKFFFILTDLKMKLTSKGKANSTIHFEAHSLDVKHEIKQVF
jgi:hypothetical protein